MSNTLFRKYSRFKNTRLFLLLCKTCFLTFFFSFCNLTMGQEECKRDAYRVVFWNVENLFDTEDDTLKNDDAFTPQGENHWTQKRYKQKLTNICRVLAAMGARDDGGYEIPQLIGLAEVENDKVLRDLCKGTQLRQYGYDYVHYESPDTRGIDNALLYRKEFFKPYFTEAITVCDSSIDLVTRDILLVEGLTREGATLILIVNHFPSKISGASSDIKRKHVAHKLQQIMDTLQRNHPMTAIVVMGDFNAEHDEPEISQTLMQNGKSAFVNLMSMMGKGTGSHNYQGHWSFLDQIIVLRAMLSGGAPLQVCGNKAHLFAPDFMLVDDERNIGKKPFRTYLAMKYLGGYSDHLPIYVDIK